MKHLATFPLRILNGFLDRACALVGALLMAQFPQFFAQYIQRLGGHLDEARLVVATYEQAAADTGLSLEQYITEHLASGSEIFTSSGEVMVYIVERLHYLERSFVALADAAPLTRWWVFLTRADWTIAGQAWRDFTPGVPTTLEGLIFAAIGLFLGWGLYTLLKTIFRPIARRIRPGKAR